MIGYKAFDENLCCRGFQFEVGKTYTKDVKKEDMQICTNSVFHFCRELHEIERCSDYQLIKSRICEVIAGDVVNLGNKYGTNSITILREIVREEKDQLVNSGYRNSGCNNSGAYNTGNTNTGHKNTGNENSGHFNTGHKNSGNENTGKFNSGDKNTGDRNFGNYNSGDYNIGIRNTGNGNSGIGNSGNFNTGPHNFGDYNLGGWNTGPFNYGNENSVIWVASLFSHIDNKEQNPYVTTDGFFRKFCIPYNEETKSLIGTSDEEPDFYKID